MFMLKPEVFTDHYWTSVSVRWCLWQTNSCLAQCSCGSFSNSYYNHIDEVKPSSFSSLCFSSHPVEGASRRFRHSSMKWQLVWTSQPMRWSRLPGGPPRTWPGPPASLDRISTVSWKLVLTWLVHLRSVWLVSTYSWTSKGNGGLCFCFF